MDVADWLRKLGLEQYEPAFRSNEIDARLLPSLTAEDLKGLGVTLVGHRRRLLDAIAALGIEMPGAAVTTASRDAPVRASALTRLVGRDEEIELLLRRWARARAGDGQVVLISGASGLGKSRITAALHQRLHAQQHIRLRYFCSPLHQDSALFPLIDQIGHAAGFARDDTPAAKLEKLGALLARAAPPEEDVAFLADLMSLPASKRHPLPDLSPQRKKERTLEALIRQLEGLARRQPVVMVFEDAHWIDPTSRELLDLTVDRMRSLPVLLIVTFRPEFQPPWTGQPHDDAGAQSPGPARPDHSGSAARRREGAARRSRRQDRRSHRWRAIVHRGTDQKRAGERSAARGKRPLCARRRSAAACDPDELGRLADGAARPPGVGASGRPDRGRDRTPFFPIRCCAWSPVLPRANCASHSPGSSLPSWSSSEARRPTQSIASSTFSCKTRLMAACCAVPVSNCMRRSPKHSRPIPPS
jgi:hypothetical protein